MPKVLMVAPEAVPYAKTGGLADVVGALAATLRSGGMEVAVVLPRHRCVVREGLSCVQDHLTVWLAAGSLHEVSIWRAVHGEVPYYFIDCPPLYDRDGLYGDPGDFPDNPERFAVFCQAALELVRKHWRPDVLHCHDWQTALVPIYIRTKLAADPSFMGLKILLTIHNLGYQGLYPKDALARVGLRQDLFRPDALEFYGRVNLLKGGIKYADALNTVSPTYAKEIQEQKLGFGLDGLLRARGDVLHGILNGADYSHWNPETGPYQAAHYSAADLSGKRLCKAELLKEFELPAQDLDLPLLGMVSRLDSQKGFDLIEEVAEELAAEDCRIVILGSGDPKYEALLRDWAAAHPGRIAVRIAYDNRVAHQMEAGADMFLMPSRYEPCGLNQIYSLRYGTVPVVRATGGLADSVDETTGFKFQEYTGEALLAAVRQALAAYQDRAAWMDRMRCGMAQDFSWNASAARYAELYEELVG
jgi:starch synthase